MNRDLEPWRRRREAVRAAEPPAAAWPALPDVPDKPDKPDGWHRFITLRYTATEIYAEDGGIHVKTRRARYQNGRLTTEECEGRLDSRAYEQFLDQTQRSFLGQFAQLVRLLYAPFAARPRDRE